MEELKGIAELCGYIKGQAAQAARGLPMVVDIGIINGDQSLTTNSYPVPIPVGDYLVCRQLTLGAVDKVLYHTQYRDLPNDGTHTHGTDGAPSGGHGGHIAGDGTHTHVDEAPHIHDMLISPKMRSILPGDRVLVVWVGDDAVVVDIIFPAKEAFTYNV